MGSTFHHSSWRWALFLGLASLLAIPQGSARADTLFASGAFGTGVYTGFNHTFGTLQDTIAGQQSTYTFQPVPLQGGGYEAYAKAFFNQFSLGAFATVDTHDFPNSTRSLELAAGAVAYTSMFYTGPKGVVVPGYAQLHGLFDFLDVNDAQAEVDAYISDDQGRLLAFLVLDGTGTFQSLGYYCLDLNLPCSGSNQVVFYKSNAAFSSGSILIPFLVRQGVSNGVILDLWVRTKVNPYIGAPEIMAVADFKDTMTLTFDPPAGTTLTLATGEVFGAAPVPEPSALLLVGSGLFGVASALRRKLRL